MNGQRQLGRKITQLVDRLPLFPYDIDRLLTMAVKPTGDATEILRLFK